MFYTSHGCLFIWQGGAYIDVKNYDHDYTPGNSEGEHQRYAAGDGAFACINVWDYSADKATISTREEFEEECRQWIRENWEDYGLSE